ncbi:MAG: hypothetical protein U5K70_05480 [Halodesulfurarchaeum sp.]|nr:hypothetical protein [Halodesulfurarchaeum sp.]
MTGNRQRASTSLSRYDAILLAIPALFLATGLAATVFDVNHLLALATASLASGLLVADSLFFNPPVESGIR